MALSLSNTVNDMRLTINSLESLVANTIITGISSLNDVTVSTPSDGQVLVFDLASGLWVNETLNLVAGNDTEIQFNNDGLIGSDARLTFNPITGVFSVPIIDADEVNVANSATVGDLTVGTNATTQELTVSNTAIIETLTANTTTVGDFSATTITETSALKYKKNVDSLSDGYLELVEKLNPITYEFIDDDKTEYGFIAEEVYELLPELVQIQDGEIEGLRYSKMVSILTKAIQELSEKVKKLESK